MSSVSSLSDLSTDSECSEDSQEMALPAAMVLSGIPMDQFSGNLQTVFTQGSVLLKSPRSASVLQTQASSRSSTSSSSAICSSVAHCSPAVASPSSIPSSSGPSTSAPSTSGPSTSATSTSATSTLASSTSAPFTLAPSTFGLSTAPLLSTDASLSESGIASLSSTPSTDSEKSLDYYLNVINIIEQKFQHMHEYPNSEQEDNSNMTVMFEGRNVLDLGANLRSSWSLQYATLPNGVDYFFENRSQLSRVAGAEIPPHTTHTCEDLECGFVEPVYL